MQQDTIRDRLRNPQIVKIYRNMISNLPKEQVDELMNNIRKEAEGHPKVDELQQLVDERFSNV